MPLRSNELKISTAELQPNTNPNYWRSYSLNRDPFNAQPDNHATFLFGKWEHHLDLLQHLIHTENVLLAIYGCKGSGKTTLMHQLLLQITETMSVYCIDGQSELDLNELIRVIRQGFKLPAPDSDLLEEQLDHQISDIQYQDKICVLVIDRAEKLPEETLQALLYLLKQQSKTQMKFHIVLFGEFELQYKLAKLARQELSGDLIHGIQIEPLTLEETRQYIQHRLANAGMKGSVPFKPDQIDEIYQQSSGIPEHINQIAKQILITQKAEKKMQQKSNFLAAHHAKMIGAGVLVVVVAIVVSFLNHEAKENNHFLKNNKPVIAYNNRVPAAQPTQPTTTVAMTNNMPNNGQSSIPAAPQSAAATSVNQVSATTAATTASGNQGTVSNTAVSQAAPVLAPTAPASAPTVTINSIPATIATNTNSAAPTSQQSTGVQSTAIKKVNSSVISSQANVPAANNPPSLVSAEEAVLNPPKVNTNTSAVSHAAKPVSNPTTVTASNPANQAVLNASPHRYTLQILALTNQAALQKYIATNQLGTQARYFITRKGGQAYYVLIYGDYPSAAAAKAAVSNLPAAVQKNATWARSFAGIQAELNKANA